MTVEALGVFFRQIFSRRKNRVIERTVVKLDSVVESSDWWSRNEHSKLSYANAQIPQFLFLFSSWIKKNNEHGLWFIHSSFLRSNWYGDVPLWTFSDFLAKKLIKTLSQSSYISDMVFCDFFTSHTHNPCQGESFRHMRKCPKSFDRALKTMAKINFPHCYKEW